MSAPTLDRAPGALVLPTGALTAAYCRISRDGDGRGLGVERQVEDCLRLAAILELKVDPADIVEENDTSASGYSTKERVKWNRLVERVHAGEVTHIVAYSLSRLTRNMIDRERLLELRHVGLHVTTAQGQRIYPGMSAQEVKVIRYQGVDDTGESDQISERVRRATVQNAERGTPHGPYAYGWDRARQRNGEIVETINKDQANVIRETARRMLKGEATAAIVRDLNARQIPAPRGGQWSTTILTKVMLRERNVSRRVHHGEVVTTSRPDGRAAWPPIYDDDTHAAVVAYLRDPARVTPRGAQRHLLSGLLTCGRCGSFRLYPTVKGKAVPGYVCKDCAGIRRQQAPLDAYVTEVVVSRLAEPDALDWLANDRVALDAARDRLAGLRAKADIYVDMLNAEPPQMSRDQFVRVNAAVQADITAAEAAVEAARPIPGSVRGLIGLGSVEDTRAAWDLLSLNAQRDVIRSLLSITILPTLRRKLDTDAIVLDWRTQIDA